VQCSQNGKLSLAWGLSLQAGCRPCGARPGPAGRSPSCPLTARAPGGSSLCGLHCPGLRRPDVAVCASQAVPLPGTALPGPLARYQVRPKNLVQAKTDRVRR